MTFFSDFQIFLNSWFSLPNGVWECAIEVNSPWMPCGNSKRTFARFVCNCTIEFIIFPAQRFVKGIIWVLFLAGRLALEGELSWRVSWGIPLFLPPMSALTQQVSRDSFKEGVAMVNANMGDVDIDAMIKVPWMKKYVGGVQHLVLFIMYRINLNGA